MLKTPHLSNLITEVVAVENKGLCYKHRVNARWDRLLIPKKDCPVPELNKSIRIRQRDRYGNSKINIVEGRVIGETDLLILLELKNNKECFLKSDFKKNILRFEYLE